MNAVAKETLGQLWRRELSLIDLEGPMIGLYEDACRDIVALNPSLNLDSRALHFAAQGWVAGRLALSERRDAPAEPLAGSACPTSTSAAPAKEFELIVGLLGAVFSRAYVQGCFDERNGFNACTDVKDVVEAWIDENADLLVAPLDLTEFVARLNSEVQTLQGSRR